MHNPILLTAICAVVSFFIGAIPFGLILGRVFKREVGLSPAAWRAAAAPLPAVPKLPPRSQEMYV